MHRKRPQNQILQDLDRLGIEIKSSSKSSTPQNNQYKMNNFYHYSGLNVPGVNSNKSRTIDHEMTENTNTSNSNLKEILKIFYDYRIEPRQLNVLRMAFLRADKNNTGRETYIYIYILYIIIYRSVIIYIYIYRSNT